MTNGDAARLGPAARAMTLDELARSCGATPIADTRELAVSDLWESDEELDAFLADLRVSRGQPLT